MILVYAEHDNASLKADTLKTVAAAQAIGGDIHIYSVIIKSNHKKSNPFSRRASSICSRKNPIDIYIM